MPAETAELYAQLIEEPELSEFYLIGGTALALYLGHRFSEDLDFIIKTPKLPRQRVDAVVDAIRSSGKSVQRNDPEEAYRDFEVAGMALHDYSQNFIVGGRCKLTFFTAEPHHLPLLESPLRKGGPTVASFDELKNLKAIVCASRSSSRDWLDVYLLGRDHEFGLDGWRSAYNKAGLTPIHLENALKRIVSGLLPRTDPGFKALIPDPPTIGQISDFFKDFIRTSTFEEDEK